MKTKEKTKITYIPKENYKSDPLNNIFYNWEEALTEAIKSDRIITIESVYDLGNTFEEILSKHRQIRQNKVEIDVLNAYDYHFTMESIEALFVAIRYLCNYEPHYNKKRLEGIQRVKDNGVKFGRPEKTKELKKARAYVEMQIKAGERPNIKQACELAGITRQAYYKHYSKDK